MIFSQSAFANVLTCSSLFSEKIEVKSYNFENGHNNSLRSVMLRMKEFEDSIREFVEGLNPSLESKYIKDNSAQFRNLAALREILDIVYKYEKVLNHLVEHSDHMMMSPRIEMMPLEKRATFIAMYKQAYVNYLETFKKLIVVFEGYEKQDPSLWNNREAQDVLMELHSQMGAAHNRF